MMLLLLVCSLLGSALAQGRWGLDDPRTGRPYTGKPYTGRPYTDYATQSPVDQIFPDPVQMAGIAIYLLDGSTQSGLRPEVDETLDMIEAELCGEVSECKERDFFDCDCQNSFIRYNSGSEECSNLPCNLFRAVRADIPRTARDMQMCRSYEELAWAVMPLLDRAMEELCGCSEELVTAVQGCLTGRSSAFNELRDEMKVMRWRPVKRVWARLSKPLCSADCGLDASLHLKKLAQVIDETKAKTETCMDFTGVFDFFRQEMMEVDSPRDAADFLRAVGDNIWCERRSCRRELEREFSTCCFGQFLDTFNERTVKDIHRVIKALQFRDRNFDWMDAGAEYKYFDAWYRALVPAVVGALDPDEATCSRRNRDCEFY